MQKLALRGRRNPRIRIEYPADREQSEGRSYDLGLLPVFRAHLRLGGNDLGNVATLLLSPDTGPLSAARKVSNYVSTCDVYCVAGCKVRPAQACGTEIGAGDWPAAEPIPDWQESPSRYAV
jgi:hypothetical protein